MDNKINDVRSFYDKETDRYLLDRYSGVTCEHYSYLFRKGIVLDYLKNSQGSILDAGCGPAIFTKELIRMGLKPFSVDLSLEMLKKAQSLASSGRNASWINSQVEQLPFPDDAFDNVISIGVIAYTTNTLNALNALIRVLKPGGTLVVQCSNSLAPTPAVLGAKDSLFITAGLRKRKWQFNLTKHPYSRFQKMLETSGVHVEEKRSYDFRLPFVEKFFPHTAVDIMKWMQHKFQNSKKLGWFGEGYVVKARKKC
jgi:ubiquinone/menaquinone biosynthesis C-methylase UbiE